MGLPDRERKARDKTGMNRNIKFASLSEVFLYIGKAFEEEPSKRGYALRIIKSSGICDAVDALYRYGHITDDVLMTARWIIEQFHGTRFFWFPAKYKKRWVRQYDIYRAIACYFMAAMTEEWGHFS